MSRLPSPPGRLFLAQLVTIELQVNDIHKPDERGLLMIVSMRGTKV